MSQPRKPTLSPQGNGAHDSTQKADTNPDAMMRMNQT